MKKKLLILSTFAALAVASLPLLASSGESKSASAYSTSTLPTTIDLNDTSEANIRSYYSSLNSLSQSERQGTNLLKNLKTILKNGQKYYSYDSGNAIWQIYEIADRDWAKSPASSTTYGTYNSSTNKITGYTYGTSSSSSKNNPYIHALYINRDVTNQTTAWDNHNQDQWGINREHVWPKAEGFETSGAGGARGDPMHLMAGNGYANNIHSNYYYGYVKTSGSYTDCGTKYSNQSGNLRGTSKTLDTGTVFEPQDSDKGDIARAIFYMVARYNYLSKSDSDGIDSNNPNLTLTQSMSDWASSGYSSTTSTQGKMGVMTDLLAWHHADPVDEYEIHRNNLLYTNYTNNRNPFIDFPEWVDFIWGTASYTGSTYNSYNSTPTGYATPSSDTINGYNSGGSSDPVSVTGVSLNKASTSIEVGSSEVLSASITPANATNQAVSWTSSNTNIATVSNSGRVTAVAEGSATITVTTSDGSYTDTCAVTVTAASGTTEGTEEGSITAASGSLAGWTSSGTGSAYADGSVKFDSSSDNVYKTDIFSGSVSSGMTSLTVTINSKINGTPTAANSYKVEALDSSGNVLASDVQTGASIVTTSYGDTVFTIDSGLTGCTGIKITYVTKGGGNWGIKSVAWSATYSTETVIPTLSTIAVKTAPTKLTYTAGDSFAPTGLVITATYTDASTTDIAYAGNEDAFEFDPSDNLQTSDVSVDIIYGGKTCSQAITVSAAKTLSSITLNTDDVNKTFYVDDDFEHDNLVVTAHYSDSSTDVVSSSATVTTPDMSTAGDKTVTVSYTYGGTTKTATYTITVIEGGSSQSGSFTWDLSIASYNTPTSAALVTWSSDCATLTSEQASGKTAANNYLGGDSNSRTSSRFYSGNTMRFTPASGYEITSVVYTATSTTYANALNNSTWTNATAAVSSTTVTITPTDGTSQFYAVISGTTGGTSIVVNYSYTPAASLTSITLDTTNVQTTFAVGDTFNYTGLVVTAHYSDSTSSVVTPSSVSTPNMASAGNKTVTVTYETESATYTITVSAEPSLSWTAPTINVYSGSTLTSSDANAWAVTYNDGTGSTTVLTSSQFTIKLGGSTISLPYTWDAADDGKTLYVEYSSLSTSASAATVKITQTINAVNAASEGSTDVSDLTFTSACSGSGTADDSKTWTITSDAAESTYDATKGIHYGTGKLAVEYIQLTSSSFTSGTITQVVVNASGASGVTGSVSVTVGGNQFDEVKSFDATASDKTFTGSASAGQIVVRIYKASAAVKAIYCKSVKVTVTTPGESTNIANSVSHIDAQRAVVKFAKAFNAAMDTTSNCTVNMSSAWSTASSAWSTFLSEAAALGSTEEAYAKNLIKNATAKYTSGTDSDYAYCLERAMATYEICVANHGQTAFMSTVRSAHAVSPNNPLVSLSSDNMIIVVVITTLIGLTAIGGYFLIRKRKED